MDSKSKRQVGIAAAFLAPMFMGFTPIFGRLTISTGVDAYTLAALRTCAAAAFLWICYLIFWRKYIYIFPAGLMGTFAVGMVNGLGSLLYYNGLLLLDNASITQLLNMTYIIFVMLLTAFLGRSISKLSIVRAGLALFGIYLLTMVGGTVGSVKIIGALLMIGSAFLFALHVILSQRVMFEMPAPTMTLYALTWMGLTVVIARLVYGYFFPLPTGPSMPVGWWYLGGLAFVTALSRLMLFTGVRQVGGLQALLLNMAEVGVTLLMGFLLLDETLTLIQWGGVVALVVSVLLARWDTGIRNQDHARSGHSKKAAAALAAVQSELTAS